MNGCIYLRKSRSDEKKDIENNDSTLVRHKEILLNFAEKNNLSITQVYEEIVSGDKLSSRPQMLKMLEDIKNKCHEFVLVMDIDRLGRGNMEEQGFILNTFKSSDTIIITPRKQYDLNNEFDEEYSEFETFMARKELKIITRRMQRGRIKSLEDGNYIYTYPPLGYKIIYKDKKRLIEPDTKTAPIVEKIFNMYIRGIGSQKIADELNRSDYKTSFGNDFTANSVLSILKNAVYCGYLLWNGDKNNIKIKSNHTPIISERTFEKTNQMLTQKKHTSSKKEIKNPFAGLILCGYCHKKMQLRPYKNSLPYIICTNTSCKKTKSTRLDIIETQVLKAIDEIFEDTEFIPAASQKTATDIKLLKIKQTELEVQIEKIHVLFEKSIYSEEKFKKRLSVAEKKLKHIKVLIDKENSSSSSVVENIVFDSFSKDYTSIKSLNIKNQLFKSFIEKIMYYKSKTSDDMMLKIYFKI